MQFKHRIWQFAKRSNEFLISNEFKQKAKILKGSLLSILAGFIIAGIVIAIQNVNPFGYFVNLLKVSFNPLYIDQTMQWLAVYIVAGLAIAVGFKSGVFNIGVSGQMLMGASISTIVYKIAIEPNGGLNPGWIILLLLICIASGALLTGIAGVLKAWFNIHEVVSTIMLSWIVWYVFKFLFVKYNAKIGDGLGSGSAIMPEGTLAIGENSFILPIIIALIAVVIVGILLSKTVFGFNLKAVGKSKTASKYAGINVKSKIIQSLIISGSLAGLASFINMFTVAPNTIFSVDSLPTVGYDAIAISLVAFNGVIGIVLVSFLWALIQSGGVSASSLYNLPTQMSGLIFGIIVYFAAISIVFTKFVPIYWVKLQYYISSSKVKQFEINQLNKKIMKYRISYYEPNQNPEYKLMLNEFKTNLENTNSKIEKQKLKKQFKEYKKQFKQDMRVLMNKYQNQLDNFKTDLYVDKINSGMNGIHKYNEKIKNQILIDSLTDIERSKIHFLTIKNHLLKESNQIINWKQNQITLAKQKRQKEIIAADVWKEGNLGDTKLDYMLFNGKIDIKGEFQKSINKLNDEFRNAKSDLKLKTRLILKNDNLSVEEKKKQVNLLKQNYVTLKQKNQSEKINLINWKNQEIQQLIEKHQVRSSELKKDNSPIAEINSTYNQKISDANNHYIAEIKNINQEYEHKKSLFDSEKSALELNQLIEVYKQGLEDLKTIQKPNDSVNLLISEQKQIWNDYYENIFDKIEAIKSTMQKICTTPIFKEHEDHKTIKNKAKLFIKLEKINSSFIIDQIILQNRFDTNYQQAQNNLLVKEFKNQLKLFKVEFKQENKNFYQQNIDKNNPVWIETLTKIETKYENNIENFILKMSSKCFNQQEVN